MFFFIFAFLYAFFIIELEIFWPIFIFNLKDVFLFTINACFMKIQYEKGIFIFLNK